MSALDFMRSFGTAQAFLGCAVTSQQQNVAAAHGQAYFDYALANYFAAEMRDEPAPLTRITFKDDPKCAYCEIVCLGPICRNCGARRVSP